MPAQRTWEQREAGANSHLVRERLVYSAELKPELMASSVSPYLDKATWPLAGERLCRLSCCDRHHFHTSSSPAPPLCLSVATCHSSPVAGAQTPADTTHRVPVQGLGGQAPDCGEPHSLQIECLFTTYATQVSSCKQTHRDLEA